MLTGTPLDLTPFGVVLQGIGLLYWLLVSVILAVILIKVKGRVAKWLSVVAVLAIMVGPVALYVLKDHQERRQAKAKLDAAMVHFEMRCRSAGEKIIKTIDNVDGIVWMKWRPDRVDRRAQFKLDDPYGTDCLGEECIKRLLRVTKGAELNPEEAKQHGKSYGFVETLDPRDDRRYRYIAVIKSISTRTPDQIEQYKQNSNGRDPGPNVYGFALERGVIDQYTTRYGITWDDISTREDREKWIAGGSLKAVDLQTNEIIAERSGFLIDPGQGSTEGFRDPWGWAKSYSIPCPRENEYTWTFATKIIRPSGQGK
ncbi:hypothetical protein BH11PSE11_BH11PSE11_04960 [soil metagenome]